MLKKKEENTFFSKKNIFSFIIVVLMVSSILAIWQGSDTTNALPDYNDHDITLEGNKYLIKSSYGPVSGYTYPSSLENILLDKLFITYLLSSSNILLVFDPNDPELPYIEVLRSDLVSDLALLDKTVSFGVTSNTSLYPYPVIECATTALPTLYLRTRNETLSRIFQESGCIILEASTWQDLVLLKDRLVYTMTEVME